ncbi:MAG: hypothetical protein AB1416_01805 [Actinomycetota bacterium]
MARRMELGFEGGSVLGVTLADDDAAEFTKSLGNGDGWRELNAQEGTYFVNLGELVYVRLAPGEVSRIGFGER